MLYDCAKVIRNNTDKYIVSRENGCKEVSMKVTSNATMKHTVITLDNNDSVYIQQIWSENKLMNRLYFVASDTVVMVEVKVELTINKLLQMSGLLIG